MFKKKLCYKISYTDEETINKISRTTLLSLILYIQYFNFKIFHHNFKNS